MTTPVVLRRALPYAIAVVAFYCLWQANSYYRVQPFTDDQWRQLGWTCAGVAAVLYWRQRKPTPRL
jgi:hypothetical protein